MAKPHIRLRADAGTNLPALVASSGLSNGFSGGIGSPAYRAASLLDRDVAAWRPRSGSADAELLPSIDVLRARARDIDRNSGIAAGGIQTIVDNVVGTGLRLAARPDYKALGQTKEWADNLSAQIQSEWQGWAWTTACDASDESTWDQLTAQALRSQLTNGDALATMLWLPGRDAYATKIQTIESDRLSNPFYAMDGPMLRGGKVIGAHGEPTGYWIRNAHPGDAYMVGGYNAFPAWELIPRRTPFGRLRMLHVYDKQRSEQSRGKPLLASVMAYFKQADRYINAEIAAAVANGMIALIMTTPLSGEELHDLFENHRDEWLQIRKDHAVALESGSIIPLAPGDKMESFMPQRPAAQFGAFLESVFRIIAVGMDMPYELLLKDFSKTTYSSARSAMLEAWRSFNRRRDWLGTQWCDPVYANFLEELVNDGRIDAPGFYDNRAAYQRCKWIGPGRGWVDPVKEAMAAQIRIDSGISTLEIECAEQSQDWEDIMDQRGVEIARAKEKNIPQVVSGRATIIPENATDAAGEATPGAAPAQPGASGASWEYTLSTPGEPSNAQLAAMLARIEARLPKEAEAVT